MHTPLFKVAAAVCACATHAVCAGENSPVNTRLDGQRALFTAPQLRLEEVYVEGQRQQAAAEISPTTSISAEELESINMTTVEDAVSYEPNLVVRRRFIGDANGSLGIRGSNMFQTARTLVYADGLPLHYHLQTRWSGAPRWSLVSPDEIAAVDVLYGPFSAAYSGNAMGGAVRITTTMPSERTVKVRAALFDQHYQQLATDEHYRGGRFNLSYGETLGDWQLLTSYNRLENEGQPMSQFAAPQLDAAPGATRVTGAVPGADSRGRPVVFYGDSGPASVSSELFKFKSQFEGKLIQLRGTLAYEDRSGHTRSPNNFLVTDTGEAIWEGPAQWQDQGFTVNPSNFGAQQQQRRSLLAGIGASAPLGGWTLELDLSRFAILEDEATGSLRHTDDPAFSGAGRAHGV
jgi:iron complex outermembrane receptor protein